MFCIIEKISRLESLASMDQTTLTRDTINQYDHAKYAHKAYSKFKKFIQDNFNSFFDYQSSQVLVADVLSFHGDTNKYKLPRISFNFSTNPDQNDWREINNIPVVQSTYPHEVVLNTHGIVFDFVMDAFCNKYVTFDVVNSYLADLVIYALIHQYIRHHKNDPNAECLLDRDLEKAISEFELVEFFRTQIIAEGNFKEMLRDKLGKVFVFYNGSVINKSIIQFLEQSLYVNYSEYKKFVEGESAEVIDHIIKLADEQRYADAIAYKYFGTDQIESLLLDVDQRDISFMKQNTRILNTHIQFVHREFGANQEKAKFVLTVFGRNQHQNTSVLALMPLVEKISSLDNCIDHIDKLSALINLYDNSVTKDIHRKYVLINYFIGNNKVLADGEKPVVDLTHYNFIQEYWDDVMVWKYANDYNREAETLRRDMDQPFKITVEDNPCIEYKVGLNGAVLNSAVHSVGIDLKCKLVTSSEELLEASNLLGIDLTYTRSRLVDRKDMMFLFGYRGEHGVCLLSTSNYHNPIELLEIISAKGLEYDVNLRDSLLIMVNELNKYKKSLPKK